MFQREEIIKEIENPKALEKMYNQNKSEFKALLKDLYDENPDSQILEVWYYRLFSEEGMQKTRIILNKGFIIMLALAILSGIISRFTYYLVSQHNVSEINFLFGVVPFIGVLFLFENPLPKKSVAIIGSVLLLLIMYFNILPNDYSDRIIITYLHLPVLLWVMLGYVFVLQDYKNDRQTLAYLKFNGEFLLIYVFIAIAGVVLSLVTMLLFSFINLDIYQFYFENIVLVGVASLAVFTSYFVLHDLKIAKYVLPLLAKIFGPLFLVTLLLFLISIIFTASNPFTDRDFLLLFNAILVLVLGVTVFSVIERSENSEKDIFDYVNIGMLITALIINVIALSAIIFRLTSYGITPNRVAVILMNLIVFAHLLLITIPYFKFIFRGSAIEFVGKAITKYMIVYGVWATVVILLFPLLF